MLFCVPVPVTEDLHTSASRGYIDALRASRLQLNLAFSCLMQDCGFDVRSQAACLDGLTQPVILTTVNRMRSNFIFILFITVMIQLSTLLRKVQVESQLHGHWGQVFHYKIIGAA